MAAGDVWLQFAAVNFGATIFDTNDLSIVRGSSLRVLEAGKDLLSFLEARFAGSQTVSPLYVGASELVVRFHSKVERPIAVALDPPFGGKQQWRERDLPALVARAAAGEAPTELAAEFIEGKKSKLKAAQIARQIGYLLARDTIRAEVAAAQLDAAAIDEAVRAFLAAPDNAVLRHFSFAYETYRPVDEDRLNDILAMLATRLRTRQLQSCTLAVPEPVAATASAAEAFCGFTQGRQPSAPGHRIKGRPASASAYARQREGRSERSAFYLKQLAVGAAAAEALSDPRAARLRSAEGTVELLGLPVATDFEEMVARPPPGTPPNVAGKLAVIFLDGNGFGAKRRQCAAAAAEETAFDHYRRFCLELDRNNGLLLAELVNWMLGRDAFRGPEGAGAYLRFETLLWGGDDVCFVLPAWGLSDFLVKLHQALAGLKVTVAGREETPTYKCGIALAHYKSPIRDLRRVADDLAHAAKATSDTENIVQIMTLEGLDRADLDPNRLRKELFGPDPHGGPPVEGGAGSEPGAFGMRLADWERIREVMNRTATSVGRSQLHRWYLKAEQADLQRRGHGDEALAKFMSAFDARLGALGVPAALVSIIAGREAVLAAGAERWPLLPLYGLLTLADYIECRCDVEFGTRGRSAA